MSILSSYEDTKRRSDDLIRAARREVAVPRVAEIAARLDRWARVSSERSAPPHVPNPSYEERVAAWAPVLEDWQQHPENVLEDEALARLRGGRDFQTNRHIVWEAMGPAQQDRAIVTVAQERLGLNRWGEPL